LIGLPRQKNSGKLTIAFLLFGCLVGDKKTYKLFEELIGLVTIGTLRTSDAIGHEVDFLWQNSEKLNLVEIKTSETILPEMFKGWAYLEKFIPDLVCSKTLVHTGLFDQNRTAGQVLSWKHILRK
jgi:hypothetical protein